VIGIVSYTKIAHTRNNMVCLVEQKPDETHSVFLQEKVGNETETQGKYRTVQPMLCIVLVFVFA
jgi:hypothetical protein